MSEWQPIDTAPKDGSWLLAWLDNGEGVVPMAVLSWEPFFNSWMDDYGKFFPELTRWMPLPAPPQD